MKHKQPDPNVPEKLKGELRTVTLKYTPDSKAEWVTYTTVRTGAGREWTMLSDFHRAAREGGGKWPTLAEMEAHVHGKFPELHSQTVQQIVHDFHECIGATTAKRKAQARRGEKITAEYPHAAQKYHQVIYTNQAARIRDGYICVTNGKVTQGLHFKLPRKFVEPGRLMELKLWKHKVHLVYELPVPEKIDELVQKIVTATDLGVNSAAAVTDGERVVIINGRAAKAIVQGRNKELASLQAKKSKLVKGSRRDKKLGRRKAKMLAKHERRITDFTHKVTARIKKEFPHAKMYVGEPFNEGAKWLDRIRAQQVSQCSTGRIIRQLEYKLRGTEVIPEPYTSRTCPHCLRAKRRCRDRFFKCNNRKCGLVAPRDAVGAVNIRSRALYGEIQKQRVPTALLYVRPLKYPGRVQTPPGSSGGTPACSSATKTLCESESTRSSTL